MGLPELLGHTLLDNESKIPKEVFIRVFFVWFMNSDGRFFDAISSIPPVIQTFVEVFLQSSHPEFP